MMMYYTVVILIMIATAASGQELTIGGFSEYAIGGRIETNRLLDREHTLNEVRLRLQFQHSGESTEFFSAIDFLTDRISGGSSANVREANIQFALGEYADVKAGRQVLTWGTGDLLFINDMFPKDYISFFTGREDQYLKLSSDALKTRIFTPHFNVDFIIMPSFDADQLPFGERLSSFNPFTGQRGGTALPLATPEEKFSQTEIAARVSKYFGSFQAAGYLFDGHYKNPQGMDPYTPALYYPELTVLGASLRGPFLSGVLSLEYGYYNSKDDKDGNNPMVPNSQHKFLAGYEQQFWTDFTLGTQYYVERMADYDAFESTLPMGAPHFDETRQVITVRATQMMQYQLLNLSLFAFVSPTDEDWHLRPAVSYRISDEVQISVGGNFFGGDNAYTLFGQFKGNNNMYARFRYFF